MSFNTDFWGQHIALNLNMKKEVLEADAQKLNKDFEREFVSFHKSLSGEIEKTYTRIDNKIQLLRTRLQTDELHQLWKFKLEMREIKRVAEEKLFSIYGSETDDFEMLKDGVQSTIDHLVILIEDENRSLLDKITVELQTARTDLKFQVSQYAKKRSEELANIELKCRSEVEKMRNVAMKFLEELLMSVVWQQQSVQAKHIDKRIRDLEINLKHLRMSTLADLDDIILTVDEETLLGIYNLEGTITKSIADVGTLLGVKVNSLYRVIFLQVHNLQYELDGLICLKRVEREILRSQYSTYCPETCGNPISKDTEMKPVIKVNLVEAKDDTSSNLLEMRTSTENSDLPFKIKWEGQASNLNQEPNKDEKNSADQELNTGDESTSKLIQLGSGAEISDSSCKIEPKIKECVTSTQCQNSTNVKSNSVDQGHKVSDESTSKMIEIGSNAEIPHPLPKLEHKIEKGATSTQFQEPKKVDNNPDDAEIKEDDQTTSKVFVFGSTAEIPIPLPKLEPKIEKGDTSTQIEDTKKVENNPDNDEIKESDQSTLKVFVFGSSAGISDSPPKKRTKIVKRGTSTEKSREL